MMQIKDHILQNVKQVSSPNCDDRPEKDISLLVIHGISLPPGQYGGPYIEQFFTNNLNPSEHPFFEKIKELKVSSHVVIRRGGEVIQFVPFNKRAWHCGVSQFKGRNNCNDFSIGIELEGTDEEAYTNEQYNILKEITGLLVSKYSIDKSSITGHENVAPGRKTDPGPFFEWDKYLNEKIT